MDVQFETILESLYKNSNFILAAGLIIYIISQVLALCFAALFKSYKLKLRTSKVSDYFYEKDKSEPTEFVAYNDNFILYRKQSLKKVSEKNVHIEEIPLGMVDIHATNDDCSEIVTTSTIIHINSGKNERYAKRESVQIESDSVQQLPDIVTSYNSEFEDNPVLTRSINSHSRHDS